MFILSDVQDIVEKHFSNDIYGRVTDYIENLSGGEFAGIFENDIDYAVCENLGRIQVLAFDEEKFDGQTEISGTVEVGAEVIGYVHWDGEEVELDTEEVSLMLQFSFYEDNGKFEDFEILDIYI